MENKIVTMLVIIQLCLTFAMFTSDVTFKINTAERIEKLEDKNVTMKMITESGILQTPEKFFGCYEVKE